MFKTLVMLVTVLALTACGESNDGADKDNNDTFETAKTIVPGSPVNGSMDVTTDEFDYYQFNVTETSDVEITFTNATDLDAYMGLYNENQSKVTTGYDPTGSGVQSITRTLEPGLYYILLEAYNDASSYTLSLKVDSRAELEAENNKVDSIGLGDTKQGSMTQTNQQDIYQFTLTEDTYVVAELTSSVTGRTPDISLELFNGNNTIVDWDFYSATTAKAFVDKNLGAGTYTLVVKPLNFDLYDYELKLFDGSL